MILFLDFDGVLHPGPVFRNPKTGKLTFRSDGHNLFENVDELDKLLGEFPTVQIVLSTSWVQVYGFDDTKDFLPVGLASRVIGSTYHSANKVTWCRQSRYQQIATYVGRHRLVHWLAVDDDVVEWNPNRKDYLVATKEYCGLSDPMKMEELRNRIAHWVSEEEKSKS